MPPQSTLQELLTLGPFGGLDLTTSPFYVQAPNFIDMQNVVPNRQYVGYSSAQGRAQLFNVLPSSITQNATYTPALTPMLPADGWTVASIFQFNGTFAPYFISPQQVYIILYYCSGSGAVTAGSIALAVWSPLNPGMPLTQIWGPGSGNVGQGYTRASSVYTAATQNRWLFIGGIRTPLDGTSNGNPAATAVNPVKIDTTNMVVSAWGLYPAATAPTVAVGAAGTLAGQYNYCVTFSTPYQESSQGAISATVTVANQAVNLSAIPVSTDPQVTARNIYRIGGSLAQWLLIGSLADNTTTTYVDNLADAAVVGQTLIYNRDPPQGFFITFQHKERIWGFGYAAQPSDLWYTNYNEPWGFNNGASAPQVLYCGRNTNNDQAVAAGSIGSVAILLKRKTTWAVYGDSNSDFIVRKLFDIGCVAPRSAVFSYGVCFWLSRQGVYTFDGNTPTNISDGTPETGGIKGFLSNPAYAGDVVQATGFVFDRIYYLSFPTLGFTLGYDIRSGTWHKLSWSASTAMVYSDPENSPFAVLTGRIGAPYAVDQWFAAESDLTNPITNYVTTGISDSNQPNVTKEYRFAFLEAPLQAGVTATFTLLVDPFDISAGTSTGRTQTFVQVIDLSKGPTRHWFSLPAFAGNTLQCQVSCTSTTPVNMTVWRIGVYGQTRRINSPEGDS